MRDIVECEECGEFDGKHRGLSLKVTAPCSERDTAQILTERSELMRHVRALDVELDKRRVKCPTCRCRILPGATCVCCEEPAYEDE
jgi:hypothetical protein